VRSGLTLDAGALLALEKRSSRMTAILARADRRGLAIAVPAPALAQVWRDGAKQVRLERLVASHEVVVVSFDELAARAAGVLLGHSRAKDVVDASVVLCARQRDHAVVTSDPQDLRRLDPALEVIAL
jgi:hypothetical protein